MLSHPSATTRGSPGPSSIITFPASSFGLGWKTKAIRAPPGSTRAREMRPLVSQSTPPSGCSRRKRRPTWRTRSKVSPSPYQSASTTSSATGRGAPPEMDICARVPIPKSLSWKLCSVKRASSPLRETDTTVPLTPSAVCPGRSSRVE